MSYYNAWLRLRKYCNSMIAESKRSDLSERLAVDNLSLWFRCDPVHLVERDKAPLHSVDGYIMTGYRPSLDYMECLESMFYLHNQTMNIWSSVFLVIFNAYLVWYFTSLDSGMPTLFYVFFGIQGFLRCWCWMNSWLYHTFMCHKSDTVVDNFCKADYIGCYLTPLGVGTNLMFIELYCHQVHQSICLLIGFLGIAACIVVAVSPSYQSEAYRSLRMCLSFGACLPYVLGIVVAVTIAHHHTIPSYYLYLLYGFIVECCAAFFYVSMFPERIFPNTFDCWLPSHSIWHWINTGFDVLMMAMTFGAYVELKTRGQCDISCSNNGFCAFT